MIEMTPPPGCDGVFSTCRVVIHETAGTGKSRFQRNKSSLAERRAAAWTCTALVAGMDLADFCFGSTTDSLRSAAVSPLCANNSHPSSFPPTAAMRTFETFAEYTVPVDVGGERTFAAACINGSRADKATADDDVSKSNGIAARVVTSLRPVDSKDFFHAVRMQQLGQGRQLGNRDANPSRVRIKWNWYNHSNAEYWVFASRHKKNVQKI